MDYLTWLAHERMEEEMRRAEAIAEAALEPTDDEIDDMQDGYDNAAYGGKVNYYTD